jgi:ribosomal protein S18 acetylase RimI-like enzyme
MRPYRGEVDRALLTPILQSQPLLRLHLIDFPWKISTPKIEEGQDACLWLRDDTTVIGFAAWQYYWAVLDYYLLAGNEQDDVEREIFSWAEGHFRRLDQERGFPLPYWIGVSEQDHERLATIESYGYNLDDDFHLIRLERDFSEPIAEPQLPSGFLLRPLAGEHEVAAYVDLHRAAFDSTSMTVEWRTRTIHDPLYRPQLDLVVEAPNGRLAAFCVGWLNPEHLVAQIEPLGVHPDFQRHGLSRALQSEMLRRFKDEGARKALVETDNTSSAALKAYEDSGFRPVDRIIRKGREFS